MSDPIDSSSRQPRARGFRIFGWLAAASMLALALLGPSAGGVAALSGAVYTSNIDGSIIDANHYATKGDVYLTGGPCGGGSHLAAGDYYFEVVQPAGGGALLSTDAVGNRKFTVGANGFISSTTGTHATHAVTCNPAVTGLTIQLIPFGDSSNATYKLQVATASSVEDCSGFSAESKTFQFCQQADQKSDNFHAGMAQPTIATVATGPVVLGATISDTATVSGGASPTGTVDFALYGPSDPTCDGTATFTSNKRPLSAGGTATSASFITTQAGTYHWIASYSGDDSNLPAAGACGDANETSIVTVPGPTEPRVTPTPTGSVETATGTPGVTPPNTATDIDSGSSSDGWRIPALGLVLLIGTILLLTPSRTVRRRR